MGLDLARAARSGHSHRIPDPDEVARAQRHRHPARGARHRRQRDHLLDGARHPGQAFARRACERPADSQLGGRGRLHRNAHRLPRPHAFLRARHDARVNCRVRFPARDPDARERQLCCARGHRVAELFRYARRPHRQRAKLHCRRSDARHVRAGRRDQSPFVADHVSSHGRHRRPGDHAQRQAGDRGWRGRARVPWRDHGGARGSVAAACRRAPRASRPGSRLGGRDDRPPRARPLGRRGASRAFNPLVSVAGRRSIAGGLRTGPAKVQSSARAVFRDRRRQQSRFDVRLPDAGDLLGGDAADHPDRLRKRGEPADRTRRRPSARDRTASVARRVAVPRGPESDRRGAGAFGCRVDGRLSVRVVGLARDCDLPDSRSGARACDLPGADARLDRDRLRAGPGSALHARGHDRAGPEDVEPAAAAVPESRRTRAGRVAFEAFRRPGRAAACVFGAAAHERRTRLPIVCAG